MNKHAKVIEAYRSAYAMAKLTGVPYRTTKNWFRSGRLSDPSRWEIVLAGIGENNDDALRALANDWGVALNASKH